MKATKSGQGSSSRPERRRNRDIHGSSPCLPLLCALQSTEKNWLLDSTMEHTGGESHDDQLLIASWRGADSRLGMVYYETCCRQCVQMS